MVRSWTPQSDLLEEKIRLLKNELWQARWQFIELMPEDVRRLLRSYMSCHTRKETHGWLHDVIEKIIDDAPLLPALHAYSSERAICPLCKGESSTPYERGFSHPEGLRRHLSGWGNVGQCPILAATMKLAWEDWNDKFGEAERAERLKQESERKQRLQTEDLWLFGPYDDPVLFESPYFSDMLRGPESAIWAQERIQELGFHYKVEGRVRSYILEKDGFVVYADHRNNKKIEFVIAKTPLFKKRPKIAAKYYDRFYLQDSWKNDIRGKFNARLEASLLLKQGRL